MSREDYIIRERRAARACRENNIGQKTLAGRIAVQLVICIIIFGGVMSASNAMGIRDSVKYYLNYTVDCKASVKDIAERCRNVFLVENE